MLSEPEKMLVRHTDALGRSRLRYTKSVYANIRVKRSGEFCFDNRSEVCLPPSWPPFTGSTRSGGNCLSRPGQATSSAALGLGHQRLHGPASLARLWL